ncbi:helix-turn-helix domain-containing protein [Billgrantia endophytica]|uniref:XRE family transcriptional regulator n=1 Tax=Billgrantia endophytica TaxID=2033802 RepID=A0A2N7U435_9GAMM|nr:helix-turn-helix domain-containing protein [Halomonas endophytica]PMR75206.1 XRE family transcriptional regulator [Halomonas endophytica]
MHDIARQIATTLKSLRQQRGWSLDRSAAETGVSKAMLGQIERGESSPTVATLWKIASGFEVSFSALVEPPGVGQNDGTSLRQADVTSLDGDASGMRFATLFPVDERLGFELLVVELAPGTISESDPHASGVIEHVVVVEGELEIGLQGCWQHMKAGQGLRFAADQPHAYRNLSESRALFHDMVHYPR